MKELKKNQIFEAKIESYSSEGYGVCRISGRAVFVPRTIEGEFWQIRIVKVSSSAVYARGEKLLSPSVHRVEPECPFFLKCGGCDLWHMDYEEELRFKLEKVNNALAHIGRQSVRVKDIQPSDKQHNYRNKAIYALSNIDSLPAYGFFKERSHELVPVDSCLIQSRLSSRAAEAVRQFMLENDIAAFNERDLSGTVRHVFCRQAVNTNDAVVCVVVYRGLGSKIRSLVDFLRSACPELSGIVLNVNKNVGNTILTGDFYTLWGKAEMSDILCGHSFSIAPQAFYQINPPQAEKLYNIALDYAFPRPGGLAFELYCGAGTISLSLAQHADMVIAAEIVPEAIENARLNAANNGITNVEFICADAGEAAQDLADRALSPDVVLVDPPRKGMSEQAVSAVARMQPERVVYVSCNAATLARDIQRFNSFSYVLKEVTAVDMFPRTSHVESVALLLRSPAGI